MKERSRGFESRGRPGGRYFSRLAPVALFALLAGAGQAVAQSQQAAAAKAPAANLFHEQAGKLGVRRCASLLTALGNIVTNGAAHGVQTQAESTGPDAHGAQAVVGMTYSTPGYRGQAADVVMAAPVGDKCEGQLVRVAPFQQNCQAVVALLPAGSTAAGNLAGVPLYNLGGNQGQAMLVTSGNACVVVTVARGTDAG